VLLGQLLRLVAGDVGRVGRARNAREWTFAHVQRAHLRAGREACAAGAVPGQDLALAVGGDAGRGDPGRGRLDAGAGGPVGREFADPAAGGVLGLVDAGVGIERGAVGG